MPRESFANKKIRAKNIAIELNRILPDPGTELKYWNNAFKLVIAVALSAQTTDKSVNKVTPILWDKYPNSKALSQANLKDVEEILHSIGFYKNKAKNCINCAKMIEEDFNGRVPDNMNDLQKLPGVGRKTANIVLNVAFDKVEGIAVDTHVFRISHRLKLSNAKTPELTEKDLLNVFDKQDWKNLNHQLVLFGRRTCSAINPDCLNCPISKYCPNKRYS